MFENWVGYSDSPVMGDHDHSENIFARQYDTALNHFGSTLLKGKFFRIKSKILQRQQWLYDLNDLKSHLSMLGSCYAGIHVVPIRSIIGSEGKTADFDMDFHPLRESSRERWISMAMAYLARLTLPPIELIQVGNAYFVRDGHHRISVSREFGQTAMDAEVITWKASQSFPWEEERSPQRSSLLLKLLRLSA